MKTPKEGGVAELPPSARISYIKDELGRLLSLCRLALKGSERDTKVKAIETCVAYLAHIDETLRRAKVMHMGHTDMCARLREAAERHGLDIGQDHLDQVIIAELDRLKGELDRLKEKNA